MSLSVFSPDILPSPFVATDQLITSLAYSTDSELGGSHFSIFLVPQDSILYPTSMLGLLYAYILQNPHINRIVYLREGEQQESIRPIDTGIDFVLGKKILYDISYYDTLPINAQAHENFPIDSVFFSSHVMYARLLNDAKIVPLIIGKGVQNNFSGLFSLFDMIVNDPTTVCVVCQNVSFSFDEKDEVVVNDIHQDFLVKSFYDYASHKKKNTTLLQSEVYDTKSLGNEIEQTFQGIFAL